MLDMSSIMPIFTTPSEILVFSSDCAAHTVTNKSTALDAVTSDLFIVTSRVVDALTPAVLRIASDREACQ
jgi:site-specific DNA-cytosine methylase